MVLNFVYDAYHDQTGSLVVPESLRMKKDMTSRREVLQLKAYRTRNRYGLTNKDRYICFLFLFIYWQNFFMFLDKTLMCLFTGEGILLVVMIVLIYLTG
jgi:hypothetical protein